MMATFVEPGAREPHTALFLRIVEGAAHRFDGAVETGLIDSAGFPDLVNAKIMQPLRQGAALPRCAGFLPEYVLTRLGLWEPFQIWESYLECEELSPLVLILNAPQTLDADVFGAMRVFPIEFRVCPFFKEDMPT